MKRLDLTGQRFGRLTVEGNAQSVKSPSGWTATVWCCVCDCGNSVQVRTKNLVTGNTKSCGCLQRERTTEAKTVHGGTHGDNERLFRIWCGMIDRCRREKNKFFARYGGRGIKVCEEWLNFTEFQRWALSSGYTDEMTIDRIDVDKGYEPGNCQWMTKSEHTKKTNSERKHRNN